MCGFKILKIYVCKGILLVTMGQDSMKHFYPLSWAMVGRETLRTWKWFIELLRNSLDLADGEGVHSCMICMR